MSAYCPRFDRTCQTAHHYPSALRQHWRLVPWCTRRNHPRSDPSQLPNMVDWSVNNSSTRGALTQGYTPGSKSPGLIVLEHELSDASVQSFMAAYPLITQNGWTMKSVAELDGEGAYQNADDDTSPAMPVPLTAGGNGGAGLLPSTTSTSILPSPTNTTSLKPSASAAADSGVKKNSASPQWHSSRHLTLSVGALALVNSILAVL
jgi:hypothetical protein